MTTITSNSCQINYTQNSDSINKTGVFKISPDLMEFTSENFYLAINYPNLHMFATGGDEMSKFLMIVADSDASQEVDEDGNVVSVEYKFEAENIEELYNAIVENQALYPTEETEEDASARNLMASMLAGQVGAAGDAPRSLSEMGPNGLVQMNGFSGNPNTFIGLENGLVNPVTGQPETAEERFARLLQNGDQMQEGEEGQFDDAE